MTGYVPPPIICEILDLASAVEKLGDTPEHKDISERLHKLRHEVQELLNLQFIGAKVAEQEGYPTLEDLLAKWRVKPYGSLEKASASS